jgi:hypothetical protein
MPLLSIRGLGPILAALLVAAPAFAQTRPTVVNTGIDRPASTIFIGNSFFYYNNGMPAFVNGLMRAADPQYRLRQTMVTISGSGANWHDVDSYFRPNAIGSYSFDADNNIVFNKLDKLFDLALMMDCSQCPVHPELKPLFDEYMRKHSETVRKRGAVPVFFMSWAYADKPEMTEQLAEAYTRAGNANNALVIPAGLAFASSVKQRPDLNLYAGDKRHPSPAGTYLAAATVYAAIFGKSPVDLAYTAGLAPETAKFLQTVAWETVQGYYGAPTTAVSAK